MRAPARPLIQDGCVFGGYVAAAIVLLANTWFGGRLGSRVVGVGGDPWGFVWALGWMPHVLGAGQWPLFTRLAMAPQGANLLASTAIPLPALVLAPLTLLVGATGSYDVLATIAIAGGAFGAYRLVMRLARTGRSSAILGGALYGFGAYVVGQAQAHVNLLITVFVPIAVLLLVEIRDGSRPYRAAVLLGIAVVAQILIDEELVATTFVMVVICGGVLLLMRQIQWGDLRPLVKPGLLTAALVALLGGPFLIYQVLGPQHVSGVVVKAGKYVNDPLSLILPTTNVVLHNAWSLRLLRPLSGGDGEGAGYLGIPLILLLGWAVVRFRGRAVVPAVVIVVATILSLGPHLRLDGHDTGILLPWALADRVPLLQDVVPDRFSLFADLAAAWLLAMFVDDVRRRPWRGTSALAYLLVGLVLVTNLPALTHSTQFSPPSLTASAAAAGASGGTPGSRGDQTVLVVPLGQGQLGMYAQERDGFRYAIPEGGLFVPGVGEPGYGMRAGPLLYALSAVDGVASMRTGRTVLDDRCLRQIRRRRVKLSTTCRAYYRAALRILGVTVVADVRYGSRRAYVRERRFFRELLGVPRVIAGATIFRVDPANAAPGRAPLYGS